MNLSFFRRRRAQSSAISSVAVETAEQRFSANAASEPDRGRFDSVSADSGEQLEMPLETVLPLLPDSAVNRHESADGALPVRFPLQQILPQLAKGRVMVPLGDILKQLPAEMLASPVPYTGSDKVQIPLDTVVALISPDYLQLPKDQQQIEMSDDEIPSPFAEDTVPSSSDWLQDQTPPAMETAAQQIRSGLSAEAKAPSPEPEIPAVDHIDRIAESQPIERKPLFEPVTIGDAGAPQQPAPAQPSAPVACEAPQEWRKQWIYIPLGDLLSTIPDNALADARQSVKSRIDQTFKVPVQLEEIAAQLSLGRITLELSTVAKRLPEGVLAPGAAGEISLGIDEVIDQLPEAVFQAGQQEDVSQGIDIIPIPFKEKESEKPQDQAKISELAEPTAVVEPKAVEPAPLAETSVIETPVPTAQAPIEIAQAPIEIAPLTPAPIAEAAAEAAPVMPAPETETEDLDSIAMAESREETPARSAPLARTLSKEEIAAVAANLNTWTEDDLHQHGVGPTLTQRIFEYRAQEGGFKDPRELLQIAGIGPKLFQRVLGFSPDSLEDQARAINRLVGASEDHEMTLQEIVKCTSQLPGVEGCIVAMSDGLHMTGELPSRFDTQRVSAFAPQLFARVSQYVRELNVGTTRRFTIFTDAQPITIFKANDLFFIVIHKANRFSKVLLNKCERISQEISRMCSQETAAK